ncbi:MAG: hypothetical protein VXW32_10810 [Myxococcota bacterium]|nr:hypothetical protein [Myxococcota bacterium]
MRDRSRAEPFEPGIAGLSQFRSVGPLPAMKRTAPSSFEVDAE